MRTPSRAAAGTTALLVAAGLVLAAGSGSQAAPGEPAAAQAESVKVPGDHSHEKSRDNRKGRVSPTARQRDRADALGARARWTSFGTPASLASTGRPLATGLPAEPVAAARAYVDANRELLGLSASGAQNLELLTVAPMGEGATVLFRQRFGELPAAVDGVLSVGLRDGAVWHVSSSLARDGAAPAPATLSQARAEQIARSDAGLPGAKILRTQLVAVPTADHGTRAAYQVVLGDDLSGADPQAFATYVDARDGAVLVRESLVDHHSDNPEWDVFPNSPKTDYSSKDTRVRWCATPQRGCDEAVGAGSPLAWDVDPATGESTHTTRGNNAIAVHNWFSNDALSVGTETATARPNRDYTYPWTNQWFEEQCNPDVFTSPQRNDLDAARANLFAMHNRMHDWSYHLGFTEATWNMQNDNFGKGGAGNDMEQGNAQAGGVSGGPPSFAARDNANQITPPDGVAPITNMYLWQPIAGSFYAPCVDGDYDMSVIAHEYTHAITNRMIAGPSAGVSSPQGMSESWSDQLAMEYLYEHGYAPKGRAAFTIGEYATGDPGAGIRNYNMSESPLNYSHIDYDFVGLQVHASGEVWSAANVDIRAAMMQRYGAGNAALQKSCATGKTPVTACPGNRRWVQLVFDSFLLMAVSQVSMVDARDAMLAADRIRFGGANQDLLWNAFAKRGLGEGASSNGHTDVDPVPSFASPHAKEATVKFLPLGERGPVAGAQLFVGDYQARAVPMADTDAATPLTGEVKLVPGTYEFVARAPGRGHVRVGPVTVRAGQVRVLPVLMRANLAAGASGASVSGDGINLDKIVDDDEATNWASLNSPVAGKQVTVDLAGGVQEVRRVQVSAMLRPTIPTDADNAGQNRFSALRQFRVLACTAHGDVDCSDAADFWRVYTSPADAFPSVAPRPRAPELLIRSFDIPRTKATHLRLEVVTNQCTGAPDYAGEQDNDPRANTDCATASPQALNVRVAEFQAFAG
ncbi:Fungalysin metallopeptidase (M36) [Micromonospora pattaloongensis]|uniref:Fungalysin metallopeptidase (M36) n=1 Tax=Micromonospora pattaloongensis TaxID=405436 RepID=A0A1H3Q0S0_9ACTN|nr:M36 family metallopeptidase [Micromonospora pattaloongensis]SDZ06728.1 Fungalysin metallopeptidase (M36) [Micromonospora pattaloongensis]